MDYRSNRVRADLRASTTLAFFIAGLAQMAQGALMQASVVHMLGTSTINFAARRNHGWAEG